MRKERLYKLHILSPGTHEDMDGQKETYTSADIKEIRDSYDPSLFEASVVVGHQNDLDAIRWGDRAPSYGDVKNLEISNGNLYANVVLSPEMEDWLTRSPAPYKYRSAAFYKSNSPYNPQKGKLYLRHIAILGANPPAIKGLEPMVRVYSERERNNPNYSYKDNLKIMLMDYDKDMNSFEELQEPEEVELPDEDSSPDEVRSFMSDHGFDFLAEILQDGENGYVGEISSMEPMPSLENNFLYDANKKEFRGVFFDDTSDEVDGYNFIISNEGGTWFVEYDPVSNDIPMEDQVDLPENKEDAFAEEIPEESDKETETETSVSSAAAPIQKPLVSSPSLVEEKESLASSAVPMSARDEGMLAKGKLPELELDPELGSDGEADDSQNEEILLMRKQLIELKAEMQQMKESQFSAYAESLYEKGTLVETLVPKGKLINFLRFLENSSGSVQARSYSESNGTGSSQTPYEWFKELLDSGFTRETVSYGECKDYKEGETKASAVYKGPDNASVDPEALDIHQKALAYCKENNLNPKTPGEYIKAVKAVSV